MVEITDAGLKHTQSQDLITLKLFLQNFDQQQ